MWLKYHQKGYETEIKRVFHPLSWCSPTSCIAPALFMTNQTNINNHSCDRWSRVLFCSGSHEPIRQKVNSLDILVEIQCSLGLPCLTKLIKDSYAKQWDCNGDTFGPSNSGGAVCVVEATYSPQPGHNFLAWHAWRSPSPIISFGAELGMVSCWSMVLFHWQSLWCFKCLSIVISALEC
jgi:hypothetical protein